MPFPPLLPFLARVQCGGKGSNPLSSVGPVLGAGLWQGRSPFLTVLGKDNKAALAKGVCHCKQQKTPCQPEIGGNRDCPGLSLAVQLHVFFSSDSKH